MDVNGILFIAKATSYVVVQSSYLIQEIIRQLVVDPSGSYVSKQRLNGISVIRQNFPYTLIHNTLNHSIIWSPNVLTTLPTTTEIRILSPQPTIVQFREFLLVFCIIWTGNSLSISFSIFE